MYTHTHIHMVFGKRHGHPSFFTQLLQVFKSELLRVLLVKPPGKWTNFYGEIGAWYGMVYYCITHTIRNSPVFLWSIWILKSWFLWDPFPCFKTSLFARLPPSGTATWRRHSPTFTGCSWHMLTWQRCIPLAKGIAKKSVHKQKSCYLMENPPSKSKWFSQLQTFICGYLWYTGLSSLPCVINRGYFWNVSPTHILWLVPSTDIFFVGCNRLQYTSVFRASYPLCGWL